MRNDCGLLRAGRRGKPPARAPIDREALADGFSKMVEGAIILARALDEPALLGRQVRLYREMVKASFPA